MLAPSTPPTPPTPCTAATTSESSCSAPSRPPPCRDCGAVFPTLPKLKYHRLRSHGAWAGHRECPRDGCTKRYATDSNLRRHLRRDHGERAEKEGAEVSVAAAEDKKVCPVCGFASEDNFHLAVHIRKHTGERPFSCSKCPSAFSKRSDLTRHEGRCQGPRHSCDRCGTGFRYLREFRHHALWSEGCGAMRDKAPPPPPTTSSNPSEAGEESTSVVRIDMGRGRSVVGINFEELIDPEVFSRGKKRSRCGLCDGCARGENKEPDCGSCRTCVGPSERGVINRRACERRRCLNLVPQYRIRKGKTCTLDLGDGEEGEEAIAGIETEVEEEENL